VLRDGPVGRYAVRSSRLIRRTLADEPTRVASTTLVGDRRYHLVYAGEGYETSTPTTTLTVDGQGMVHALRTTFPVADSNVTAVVSFEYNSLNVTTVDPPEWYAEALAAVNSSAGAGAGNATAPGESATAPGTGPDADASTPTNASGPAGEGEGEGEGDGGDDGDA
jgi:hypothetical protein